jgi:signal transduction histidine kinase
MRVKGQALGLLNLFWRSTRHLALEEVVLLSTMADQLGVAVEIARLRQRVATTAVIEERQRLVRELHDSVTQSMYSQTLFARSARDALEDGETERLAETLSRLDENALHTLKEMRLLLYELRPSILEQEGLVQALNTRLDTVERRVGVKVQFQVAGSLNLPNTIEVELYRIAIEALNNILKHAQASQISIYLKGEDEWIALEIADNGLGFDPESSGQGGIGLKSMRERAEQLGGQFTITTTPGSGTKVILEMTREGGNA